MSMRSMNPAYGTTASNTVLTVFRRQTVGKNTEELADLEARIREMEERLRRSQRNPGQKSHRPSVLPPPVPKDARTTNNGSTGGDADSKSRPGTARAPRRAPSAGNMPPTPGASEGDYYLVTRADLDDQPR